MTTTDPQTYLDMIEIGLRHHGTTSQVGDFIAYWQEELLREWARGRDCGDVVAEIVAAEWQPNRPDSA